MKKILLAPLFVVFTSIFVYAKSGVFIGADVGASFSNKDFIKSSAGDVSNVGKVSPIYGLKLGYQQYFGFIGLRAYGSANLIEITRETTISQAGGFNTIKAIGKANYNGYNLGANVDLLFKIDFVDVFGMGAFVGIGYEYAKFKDTKIDILSNQMGGIDVSGKIKNISGDGLVYNVGLQAMILGSHQIELGYKFTPYKVYGTTDLYKNVIKEPELKSNIKLNGTITIGYRYIF